MKSSSPSEQRSSGCGCRFEIAIRRGEHYYRYMLAIKLSSEIVERLDQLAKRTGRTKSFFAREAILEHLEDLEDAYLAEKRLENPEKTHSAEEVKRALGL